MGRSKRASFCAIHESVATSTTAAPPTSAGTSMTTVGSSTNYNINQDGTVTYQVLFEITISNGAFSSGTFDLFSAGTE